MMTRKQLFLSSLAAAVFAGSSCVQAAPLIDDHFTTNPVGGDWAVSLINGDLAGVTRTVSQSGSQVELIIDNNSGGGTLPRGVGILNTASPVTPASDFASGVSMTTTFAGALSAGKQYRFGLVQKTDDPSSLLDQMFVKIQDVGAGVKLRAYFASGVGGSGWLSADITVGDAAVNVSAGDQMRVTFTDTTVSASFYDVEQNQEYVVYADAALGVDLTTTWGTANAYTQAYLFGTDGDGGAPASLALDRITVDVVPEPASMVLLGLGGLMMAYGRR